MAVEASRAEMLAEQFDAACRDFRASVESVPDDRWQAPTTGDGRQVNVVAHHAASAHRYIADMLQAMANGQQPSIGMDQIHAGNAEHARQFRECSKSDVLRQHDENAAYARNVLRGMDEASLATEGVLLAGIPRWTVAQAVENVLIGHPREHAATINSTLAAASG
jgi:hypothetical protein